MYLFITGVLFMSEIWTLKSMTVNSHHVDKENRKIMLSSSKEKPKYIVQLDKKVPTWKCGYYFSVYEYVVYMVKVMSETWDVPVINARCMDELWQSTICNFALSTLYSYTTRLQQAPHWANIFSAPILDLDVIISSLSRQWRLIKSHNYPYDRSMCRNPFDHGH